MPASKVNIGVAFYGRSLASCSGLFQTHSGVDLTTWNADEGIPTYYNIYNNLNLYTRYWDDVAKVPYIVRASNNTFVSYDDEESIGLKAQYVVDNGARGVIIWEISGDYIETAPGSGVIAGTPLADKLYDVFDDIPTNLNNSLRDDAIIMYPNPVNDQINIINTNTIQRIETVDIQGRSVETSIYSSTSNKIQVDVSSLQSGIYFNKIYFNDSTSPVVKRFIKN